MIRVAVTASPPAREELEALIRAEAGLELVAPDDAEIILSDSPSAADIVAALGALRSPVPVVEPRGSDALTPREREVLGLVASGLPNKTIAGRLHLSEHTVKFHLASIFAKLGAASRTEAVTRGIQLGLVMV